MLLPLRPGVSGWGSDTGCGGVVEGRLWVSHMNSVNGQPTCEPVVGVPTVGMWPCARRSFRPLSL